MRTEPAPRSSDFVAALSAQDPINRFPLIVIVDDTEFAARTLNNFLWVTFTRSNPAADMYGIGSIRDRSTGAAAARW